MKNPNIQEVTKQKLQKFYWPLWFPYPTSWLKALILNLLLSFIIFLLTNPGKVGYQITYLAKSPELFFMLTILLILSPIPTISFTHHLLHLLISRFISEIQAPEIGRIKGLFPGIMSWWEGLYAWLVIAISTLIAAFFCTMISPLFNISYTKPVESYTEVEKNIILIFGLFYISAGALTYQIEHLVRQRIISVYSGTKETDASKSKSDFNTDQELSRLRGEMGVHKMKSNVLSNKEETVVTKTKHKYRNLNKNWLVIFFDIFNCYSNIFIFTIHRNTSPNL
jgi:hypothetical protein